MITVSGSFAIAVYDVRLGDEVISVTATNTGLVPVEVTSAQLEVRGHAENLVMFRWELQAPSDLPIRLEPGGYWTGSVFLAGVKETLARHVPTPWNVRPVVIDSARRRYTPRGRGNWLTLSRD